MMKRPSWWRRYYGKTNAPCAIWDIRYHLQTRTMKAQETTEKKLSEAILRNLPGVFYQCLNNPPYFTCTFITEKCLDVLGYKPEEVIDNYEFRYSDCVHPDDAAFLRKHIKKPYP